MPNQVRRVMPTAGCHRRLAHPHVFSLLVLFLHGSEQAVDHNKTTGFHLERHPGAHQEGHAD
jgi:hypothetical protein